MRRQNGLTSARRGAAVIVIAAQGIERAAERCQPRQRLLHLLDSLLRRVPMAGEQIAELHGEIWPRGAYLRRQYAVVILARGGVAQQVGAFPRPLLQLAPVQILVSEMDIAQDRETNHESLLHSPDYSH